MPDPPTEVFRTSKSHPLRIAWVRAGRGALGLTFAPGKQGYSLGHRYFWRRSLAVDVRVLAREKVTRLVCLLEPHELDALRITALPRLCEKNGIAFCELPDRRRVRPDSPEKDALARAWHRARGRARRPSGRALRGRPRTYGRHRGGRSPRARMVSYRGARGGSSGRARPSMSGVARASRLRLELGNPATSRARTVERRRCSSRRDGNERRDPSHPRGRRQRVSAAP